MHRQDSSPSASDAQWISFNARRNSCLTPGPADSHLLTCASPLRCGSGWLDGSSPGTLGRRTWNRSRRVRRCGHSLHRRIFSILEISCGTSSETAFETASETGSGRTTGTWAGTRCPAHNRGNALSLAAFLPISFALVAYSSPTWPSP